MMPGAGELATNARLKVAFHSAHAVGSATPCAAYPSLGVQPGGALLSSVSSLAGLSPTFVVRCRCVITRAG